ncbi:MAG TPA: tetratricopeptide repeat protein, partial [Gammaproteobacteria bacterium]|nr:tetratricopeptide repeat protein [Gammaproteobacteria bacterium]
MSINHLGSTFNSKTWTLLVVASLLGACQTTGSTPLSLDEAKKVTASFKGGFVPPPRTITDITGILEQQKRKDLETLGQMRVVADEEPPVAGNNAELAMFHYKRGEKADHLGRQNQALADYQKAAELFELSNNDEFAAYALEAAAYLTSYLGNYSGAIKGIRKAIKLTRTDWQDDIVSLRYVLAGMAAEAGDFALAEQELKRARPLLNEVRSWDDMTRRGLTIIETLRSTARAMVLANRGKLDEAEALMRGAVKRWKPFKDSAGRNTDSKLSGQTYVWYLRHLALVLIAQERYVEAEVIAREGLLLMLSDYGRYSSYVASALNLLTKTLLEQGRYEEAEQLAEVTIHIYEEVGVKPESWAFNDARAGMADILVAQGKWEEALEIYTQIEHDLATDLPTFEKFFSSNLNWVFAHFNTGNIEAAATIAENIYERNKSLLGEEHYVTAEALGLLAATQVVTKDEKAALSNFRDSVPILVSRSRQSHGERDTKAFSRQRLGLILESYINLLSKIRGTSLEREAGFDVIAEAFRIADLSRGRSVQSALNASSARATIKDPELANLARREQDAQKQVSVLYGHLANLIRSEPSLSNASATKDIQTRIDDLRSAREALMEEIEGRFPDYAELINPKPPTIELVQSTLAHGEALIATYVGADRTYVWAIPHAGEVAFSSVNLGREDVEDSVAELRAALNPDAERLGDIPEFDLVEAYSLYEKLLKPVEAGWKRAKNLLVVAHGPLGYLPLSLLPTQPTSLAAEKGLLFDNYRDVPWLVRTHAVTMLPSVASLLALRRLPAGKATRRAFVGFGDPWFNKQQAAEAKSDTAKT